MQIQINTDRNIDGREALAAHISSEIEQALSRFSDHIIDEPIAWYGPIVMNTQEELKIAFEEYERGHSSGRVRQKR